MNTYSRRLSAALLTVALAVAQGRAQRVGAVRAPLTAMTGGLGMLALTPAPPLASPFALLAAPPLMPAPAVSAPPVLSAPASAGSPAQRIAPALAALELPAASHRGRDAGRAGGALFDGATKRAAAPASAYIVNDEGVKINDRAAAYYTEVRRMVDLYQGTIDLSESLGVMDDAYSDVLAKISAVEAVAKGRGLAQENTHLEETLVWVDGVLSDGAKKVAVHTHRVYFHQAKDPRSEIAEGIRRADGYIDEAATMFMRGGKAEQQMGRFDEVVLVFDARGYREIKDHLMRRGAEVAARTRGRVQFQFLDDMVSLPRDPAAIRARLGEFVAKYNGGGLSKIYEGVIYSRYVGLLLELKTIEHYHRLGYKILQSGRELFDENGMYVSELDVVVESPEGVVSVVEAKSARVSLPDDRILQDKVVYKLNTYKKFKAQLDALIGRRFDSVVFAMDVALDPNLDRARIKPKDVRKLELMRFLKSQEAALSKEYGFPVSFLFLQSGPARP